LGPGVARGEAVEAVGGLRRGSLLEGGGGGTFTLQPVGLEDATTRLGAAMAQEGVGGRPGRRGSPAGLRGARKDEGRQSQERLTAQPLLEQLRATSGSAAVQRRLGVLLEGWRGRPREEQGYGPGNVVNLLRLLRGDLRGLDLSRLAIRQAYLQG